MKEKGTVTRVSNKNDGKFGVELGDGNWFNGFGKATCNQGDVVEIEFEQNDKWKNTTPDKIKVLEESKTSATPTLDDNAKHRRITDCVLKAADMTIAGTITQEQLAEKARGLYNLTVEIANVEE